MDTTEKPNTGELENLATFELIPAKFEVDPEKFTSAFKIGERSIVFDTGKDRLIIDKGVLRRRREKILPLNSFFPEIGSAASEPAITLPAISGHIWTETEGIIRFENTNINQASFWRMVRFIGNNGETKSEIICEAKSNSKKTIWGKNVTIQMLITPIPDVDETVVVPIQYEVLKTNSQLKVSERGSGENLFTVSYNKDGTVDESKLGNENSELLKKLAKALQFVIGIDLFDLPTNLHDKIVKLAQDHIKTAE